MDSEKDLVSTSEQVRNFMETAVWIDMQTLIREQIAMIEMELREPAKTPTLEHLRILQTELKTRQDFLELPTKLIQSLEEQNG